MSKKRKCKLGNGPHMGFPVTPNKVHSNRSPFTPGNGPTENGPFTVTPNKVKRDGMKYGNRKP